jgi:hypothetical protein
MEKGAKKAIFGPKMPLFGLFLAVFRGKVATSLALSVHRNSTETHRFCMNAIEHKHSTSLFCLRVCTNFFSVSLGRARGRKKILYNLETETGTQSLHFFRGAIL